jgi:hypothetical protein
MMWFVALFVGAGVGTAIAEAVSRAAGKKRGRGLQAVTVAGMVLGVVVAGMIIHRSPMGAMSLFPSLGVLVYLVMGIGAAVARLR